MTARATPTFLGMRHRQANDCYQSIARPEDRLDLKENTTLGEGRGNTFIMFLKKVRKGDCGNVINSSRFGTFGGNHTGVPSRGECLWKKMIGKSRLAGFDEGGTGDRVLSYYASSLVYCKGGIGAWL